MLCDASCLHARAHLALSHEQDTWASKMETSDESVWRTPSLLYNQKRTLEDYIQLAVMLQYIQSEIVYLNVL